MAFIRTTDCVSDVVIVLANPTEKAVKDGGPQSRASPVAGAAHGADVTIRFPLASDSKPKVKYM